MACDSSCPVVRGTKRAHCPVCHLTFSGHTAFDRHRGNGRCVENPVTVGLVERNGIWGSPKTRPSGMFKGWQA